MPQSRQLTIEQAISQAKKATRQGDTAAALQLYNAVLKHQPNHPIAKKGLRKLQKELPRNQSVQAQTTNHLQEKINALVNLYKTGQMTKTEQACRELLQIYPQSLTVINILGVALQRQGKSQEAVQAFDKAIELKPDYAEAYSNRGNALKGLGQLKAAVESCEKAIELKPDYAEAYSNRGNVLKDLEQLKAAVESYDKAIELKPDYAEAYSNRGNALKGLGQLKAAVESCEKAIEFKPDYAEAYSNRGNALKELGQLKAAVESYDKAIELNPDYVNAYSNRGIALQELGQLKAAVESYKKATELQPDYTEAYNNRGNALKDLGQLKEAVESYDKAIDLKPDLAEAYSNRGIALKGLGQLKAAVESYEKAIKLKPDLAEAYSNRGNALKELGQLKAAVESYDKAIELKPDYVNAYSNRGIALQELGQLKAAVESYAKAIDLKPDYAEAYRNISTLKEYTPDDVQIELMEGLFTDSEPSESDRMHLCFALAKVYEDLGEYDKSFKYLDEANHIRKKELNYNINNDRRIFSKIKEIFTAGNLTLDVVPDGNASIQPLFIVGMPRSGTSLVEHILASHTKVHGAGELETMNRLVTPILNLKISQDKNKLSQNEINTIHDGYLDALAALKVPEKIITDKMPLNFRWIGFILSVFPKAKIINLNRDPRATCWSNYKHYFSSEGNGFAYDMDDLVEFHKLYIDLMSFWRERYPNSIYDLCYEDLTENQKQETHSLLEFCNLEWEEQCLDFHKTKRAVKTASAAQVRKKMYKGSSEAWRKHEEHLQPLITGLGY